MTAGGAYVVDASALLAMVGVLPLEPPAAQDVLAPDGALVDVVAVLRSFHEGRPSDVLGDLAIIGTQVRQWLPTFRFAAAVADLAISHPEQLVGDLVAVAAARELDQTFVTGQPGLARLHDDTQVLARRDS
jgi:hypothetical protein